MQLEALTLWTLDVLSGVSYQRRKNWRIKNERRYGNRRGSVSEMGGVVRVEEEGKVREKAGGVDRVK